MDWLLTILEASWTMLVLAAPFILFGLLAAGLIHVLLPESLVLRWMGGPGLWGVVRAALIGVPLPVCSCGVVPITVELRRKGASRPASQSFLITTPESSIDSIFLTWGMMGPIMAIARPVAAFFTAVLGGILSIASAGSVEELKGKVAPPRSGDGEPVGPDADHHHPHEHGHGHGHGAGSTSLHSHHGGSSEHDSHHEHHEHGSPDHGHRDVESSNEGHAHHGHAHHGHDGHGHAGHGHHDHGHDHSVAFAGSAKAWLALRRSLGLAPRSNPRDGADEAQIQDPQPVEGSAEAEATSLWRDLLRPALRYGFGELLDDLAFWLVLGIGLAGVLTALLPDDLDQLGLGTGLLPMILLLVVGIPLYMCASASTPIAAALMLKGVSPGAALVFLLAGPATNAATVLQLLATFGRRFVQIYIISVAGGALACGLLLDLLLGDFDLAAQLRPDSPSAPIAWMTLSALVLTGLLGRSLMRGAWAAGVDELRLAGLRMRPYLPVSLRWGSGRLLLAGALVALTVYGLQGIRVVPTGARGYGFLFGALSRSELEPGMHYFPPAPFGRWETRLVHYPRKSDVGFKTDLSLIDQRRLLVGQASPNEWHSPVAAMNTVPSQASFLTGDGNLVEMSFTVHYRLDDAETFFYRIDHQRDFVNLYAEAAGRELIAGLRLDELLTERRVEIEERILEALQHALSSHRLGIEVITVRIVDLHPPGPVVRAFRDVSSAKEDRETAIHKAREDQARAVPRSRGEAAQRVAEAEAQALRRRLEAQGENEAFTVRAESFGANRDLLGHLLWIESLERSLAGREKIIVPPDRGPSTSRRITLWRKSAPPLPNFDEDHR